MLHIISPRKRLLYLHGCVIVLALTALGLGACVSPPGVPGTTTSVKPTSSPTRHPLPTKPSPLADWPYRWLKGVPCRPPCWEGVTPGHTAATEAVETLRQSPVIATAEITSSPLVTEMGVVIWSWVGKEGREGGQAIFHAQEPSSPIYYLHPYLPASFSLGDVIQAYGEPSHIIAKAFPRPDSEGFDYDLRILYRSHGFILLDGGAIKPTLNADTLFGSVVFFALNDEGLRAALAGAADHPEWVVPWQGMKDFDYYCTDTKGNPCP